MIVPYECTDCGEVTMVQEWPATRIDPADSTWGDGCTHCGGELKELPVEDFYVDPPELEPRDDEPEGDTW